MLDFKLDGGLGTQTFEGVDFSDEAARAKEKERELQELKSAALGSMSLGDRAAKLGSVPPIAFQDVAVGGKSEAARRRQLLPPAHRPPASIYPWMLLDGDRINEITTQEIEHILASRAAAAAAPTDSAAAAASLGLFSAELVAERARLVAEGFPSWKLHDLEAYVQACTDYGRDDAASVVRETAKACKRPVAEVQVCGRHAGRRPCRCCAPPPCWAYAALPRDVLDSRPEDVLYWSQAQLAEAASPRRAR